MKKKYLFVLIFTLFLFSIVNAKEIKKEDLWRYDFEEAIKFALNDENLSKISNLAGNLKGSNIQESIWNILKWEEENIEYDLHKANIPQPILSIWNTGKIEVVQGEDNTFQTPYETIQRKKGICGDYALLSAGLLLKMGYSPVYILNIEFQNDPVEHTVAGMIINGWFFILDQFPPAMDSGTFYRHWKDEEGEIIKDLTLYEINRKAKFEIVKYKMSIEDFKNIDYEYTYDDLEVISSYLMKTFKDNFPNLIIDERISSLDKSTYLPKGYKGGKIWSFEFPEFLDYYNPIFHFQFIDELYDYILEDREILLDLKNFRSFFIRAEMMGNGIKIVLNLAY